MRATRKKLTLLGCALAVCVILFLALTLTGPEQPETARGHRYYFTNYNSPEALLAVSVENEEGGIVLARTNGTFRALTDFPVQGDEAEIAAFFESVSHLPLSHLVADASASDSQYGLTEPRATVLIQDMTQEGVLFLLGGAVPGGEGVYTCLSGDDRVFVMETAYASLFLDSTDRFLDLSLYPSLEGPDLAELTGIEVRRNGETAYRLRQVGASKNGSTVYFALEAPWELLLGVEPIKSSLLTPLKQLKGSAVLEGIPADYGLTEDSDSLCLRYRDGTSITVLVGQRNGEMTPIMTEGSGVPFWVPTARLTFMDAPAEEIMGRVLLRMNINDIQTLAINQYTYEIQNSAEGLRVIRDGETFDAALFQNTVFSALNHISIGGSWKEPAGAELLRLHITSNIADETIEMVFRQLDGRRCAVEIGGQMAVWCDLTALSALL